MLTLTGPAFQVPPNATAGGPVTAVTTFEKATDLAAAAVPPAAGRFVWSVFETGQPNSPPTLCVRELLRPDGMRRLIAVQVNGCVLGWTVYAEATPIRPAAVLSTGTIIIVLPDRTPLTLGPTATDPRQETVPIRVALPNRPPGSLTLVLGNDDLVSARPSFGWTPPDDSTAWAPAGRPVDWPLTINVQVTHLPVAGIGVGFDQENHLIVGGEFVCWVLDLANGAREVRAFDYGWASEWDHGPAQTVVVSPTGQRVFANAVGSHWSTCDVTSGHRLTPVRSGTDAIAGEAGAAFSPDDLNLVVGDNTRVRRFGGRNLNLSAEAPESANVVAVGHTIVVSADGVDPLATAAVRDIGSLAVRRTFPIRHGYGGGLCLSADDRWLASSDQDGIGLYDVTTGRELLNRTPNVYWGGGGSVGSDLAFLPGDRWAVVAGVHADAPYLIDVPNGRWLFRLTGLSSCHGIVAAPDGKWLAALGWSDTELVSVPELMAAVTALQAAEKPPAR